MTKIKFCGLTRPCDIQAANRLLPAYIGFVFAAKSRRQLSAGQAARLRQQLDGRIRAVGVFVDQPPEEVARLLAEGVIDLAQLHGREEETYLRRLRQLTARPVIQAFRVQSRRDLEAAEASRADYVLLDSGAGSGQVFDWTLLEAIRRPYFLAGGLSPANAAAAVAALHPYAVDVSSGIETEGYKDESKMAAFAAAVRKEELL